MFKLMLEKKIRLVGRKKSDFCVLFGLALFRENLRYCHSLVVVVVVQKLTFCHISAITDIMSAKSSVISSLSTDFYR